MNIEEFLKTFKSKMILKESNEEGDDWAIMGLPLFHLGYPDGIAIRLTHKNGQLIISDCHTTTDYLYDNNIYLEDYPDKLNKIMRKFDVYQDGEVFRMIIYDHDNPFREIGYFMEAISLIAHIDL